jgi:hypothetical protein
LEPFSASAFGKARFGSSVLLTFVGLKLQLLVQLVLLSFTTSLPTSVAT